jgi:predicted O-methyltransferase YrrM
VPEDIWAEVDRYMAAAVLHRDPDLSEVLRSNAEADLPTIDVSPLQGKLLHVLARAIGARTILEIGTLGGYSTIWLARALPENGRVVTLEVDPAHAAVARANFAKAGVQGRIELRLGKALDTLPQLANEGYGPFDFVFIDADKSRNADYLQWAVKLSRPGTLIICDNVVRDGSVVDAESTDPAVQGSRRLFDTLAAEPRVTATGMQTVGVKGYDGFAIAVVTGTSA